MKKVKLFFLLAGVVLYPFLLAADERAFTYIYEPQTLEKGEIEFEQWITSRVGRKGKDFTRWDLREEISYGLTENLSTALYLNWSVTNDSDTSTDFDGISSEWKYLLFNPAEHSLGVLLYGEATSDGDNLSLEEKIVIGQYINRWTLALNATVEQEWEFNDETEKEGEVELTGGASYKILPYLSVGVELRNLRKYKSLSFNDEEFSAWFLGPNIFFKASEFWGTITFLPQLPLENKRELNDRERVELRAIFGVEF